ncbi:uncharacterized protein BO80DRAFT_433132 [Aspergillus ibericus CBS 121593]|uniref:Uncharacterized protein n=1 Tax=Aspergillus ibericus CBS 121593 TaxID=1448316 RepID=A0A395H8B4_9EURO|nr:hypothetical protein BO80DRAFT_433132 [Aspergillus ibericus CBS 121593]RAL03385.1 hypothetical protein BO80DRAFT_433132 [Aspergillus ibericus CBS 121593]
MEARYPTFLTAILIRCNSESESLQDSFTKCHRYMKDVIRVVGKQEDRYSVRHIVVRSPQTLHACRMIVRHLLLATRTPPHTAEDPPAEQIFHFEKQSRHGNKSYDPTKNATRQSGCGSIPCDIQNNMNDYISSFNPRSHHSVLDIPLTKKCSDTSLESLSP